MPLPPGTRLGPYEIVAPIGAGGMGEVYRARDTRLRREVALKILPADVSGDSDRRARFEQEAHAAAALNHPNILSVYDIGGDDHTAYIAAELVNGETLAALIERGPVPLRALLDIAVQIADGLASAHAAHVIHRDLKPANVMIATDGRVKILDFGLAKRTVVSSGRDETIAANTVAGMIVGTVHYMSPDLFRYCKDGRERVYKLRVLGEDTAELWVVSGGGRKERKSRRMATFTNADDIRPFLQTVEQDLRSSGWMDTKPCE